MACGSRNPSTANQFESLLRSRSISPFGVVALATAAVLACAANGFAGENVRKTGSETKLSSKSDASSSGELLRVLLGHRSDVYCVAFSPDSRRVVSGSWDRTLKVWDTATGQELFTLKGHTDILRDVAYTPDGRQIVSGSDDRTLRFWDAATGKQTRTIEANPDGVRSLAISPDSKRIASGGERNTLKVWDLATGHEIFTLDGHTERKVKAEIYSVDFSPDGRQFISAERDRVLEIWDSATGREISNSQGAWRRSAQRGVQPRRSSDRLGQLGCHVEGLGRRKRPGTPFVQGPSTCGT